MDEIYTMYVTQRSPTALPWSFAQVTMYAATNVWNWQCTSLLCPENCETQPSIIQRLSSTIFPCSFVVVPHRWHLHLSPLYDVLDHTNHTFSESSWSRDIKTDISKCLMHKYTNTNTQIHKYSIYDEVPERPNMWYIFQKRIVQGY